jgi:hypothetical protein
MPPKVTRLKLVYWFGAAADLLFAVAMVVPSLWAWLLGIADYAPTLQHRLDMGVGAALMFGWTCLLLWAGQDPVRRRGVLVLTACPVLLGIGITSTLALVTGAATLGGLLWVFGLKVVLFGALGYGWVTARRLAPEVN